jgi:hypothetical protein
MKLITTLLTILTLSNAQMLTGSQRDDHGCVTDGGYQWCETTQSCIRPWLKQCESLTNTHPIQPPPPSTSLLTPTQICHDSPVQLCRMLCSLPTCPTGQCAMRTGSCCEFHCQSSSPPPPILLTPGTRLPHPVINNIPLTCSSWFDGCNTCSVNNGNIISCTMMMCFTQGTPECRTHYITNNNCISDSDCDSEHFCRPTLNVLDSPKNCVRYSQRGESCGGMTMTNNQNRCHPNLECVNTMSHAIADAPGTCQEHCPNNQHRDSYGNCIDLNCREWYDGCNTCQISHSGQLICTEQSCTHTDNHHCISIAVQTSTVSLNVGDVCYRFCENGAEPTISMRNLCPAGSICGGSTSSLQISFDTCGNRAYKCVLQGH